MKALILSAGQGRRLLPLTEQRPKCLLPIQGQALIEWQLDALVQAGIEQVTVVTGYGAAQVEQLLRRYGDWAQALYNPFYAVSDNLASCWLAQHVMYQDFILLNGDTVFEPAVLQQLLDSPATPITLTIDRKAVYDADDMKVKLDGMRLCRIGKTLSAAETDAESIGMLLFRDSGARRFRTAVEQALRTPTGLKQWYLSVIDQLADTIPVATCDIHGLQWSEIDYPTDLARAAKMLASWPLPTVPEAVSAPG